MQKGKIGIPHRVVPPFDTSTPLPIERSLARRVIEGVEEIADRQLAFEAVERLVTLTDACEPAGAALEISRSELGALLRILNASLRESIVTTTNAARSAHDGLVNA